MGGTVSKEKRDKALVFAAAKGDARKVEELLSKGARVDARDQGFTPLLAAAYGGQTEVCKLLLEKGKANVKETNPKGFTPLLSAADEGHTEVCELLLDNGSDLEERILPTEFTALHYAAINGHESLLQLLLKYKPDIDIMNRIEATPLHCASQEGTVCYGPISSDISTMIIFQCCKCFNDFNGLSYGG